ncbi:MAG TPA: hypothetical protein VHY36_13500 [Steroidobacteraceae bacterium]|jgi:hypothetical protein|nr:hypothetical protein [Steroidobacteraceae bacterium]
MKVTRNVVLDLLPLYLSGEASTDTRALIVEYLAQDPELAQRIRSRPAALFPETVPTPLPPDLEVRSLRRVRTLINVQKWLFGPAIALTAVALSFHLDLEHGRIDDLYFMVEKYPLQLGPVAALAVACWVAYHWVRRRLR